MKVTHSKAISTTILAVSLIFGTCGSASADIDQAGAQRVENSCFSTITSEVNKPSVTLRTLVSHKQSRADMERAYTQCSSVVEALAKNAEDTLHLGLVEYLKQDDGGNKDWRATAFYHFRQAVTLAYASKDAVLVQESCETANMLAKDSEFTCPSTFLSKVMIEAQQQIGRLASRDQNIAIDDHRHLSELVSKIASL